MPDDARERHGRRVREVWVAWAKRQPKPKPSWLVPWDELSAADKEADRCIGSALWGDGFADGLDAGTSAVATLDVKFMRGWETGRADVAGSVFVILHDAKYVTHRDTLTAIEAVVKPLVEAWLVAEPTEEAGNG